MAEACGDPVSRNRATTALGASLLFVDQAAGVGVLSEQLAQRRAAGPPRLVAGSLSMMGSGLGELMNLKAAEALLSESMVLAQAHEADGTRDYAAAWLALIRMWLGQRSGAATLASAVVERTAGQGMSRLMALLALMTQDLRNADIAARLHRSVRTVDHHVAAVLAKLGLDSRLAAVQRAQREGWLAAGGA